MRKLGTIGALVMAAAILFTSCEKIETSELTLDLTQTATVKVEFRAELNLTTPGLEYIPNGTNVIVSIPNNSFNATASGVWTTNAVVANGAIEVTVPATSNGVTVTFTPAEFVYAQVQTYGANSTTINKKYESDPKTLSGVKPGQERSLNATYNTPSSIPGHYEMVTLNYELLAIQKVGSPSEIVKSQQVDVYVTDEWTGTATTNTLGRISISVPAGRNVQFRYIATKDMNTGTPTTYKTHLYTGSDFTPSTTTPVLRTVNFFNGTLWE